MKNEKSNILLEIYPSTFSRILVIVFAFIILFLPDYIFTNKILWYYSIPLNLSLVWFIYLIFDFGEEIRINDSKLEYGKYHRLTKSFKIINQIKKDEIIKIDLVQNEKKYYEIIALSEKNQIVIKKMPNKIPAQEEMEKIKNKIKNIC